MPANLQYYSTFGSPMPTMQYSDLKSKYKFGFNGKEKDEEINVNGGDYDFGARIYDSRLGRWLSLDPLMSKYAAYSPYNFSVNCPITVNDKDGLDAEITINNTGTCTGNTITVKTTVLLYGPNAKDVNLENVNKIMATIGAPRTFCDKNGKEWTIQFDIQFKHSEALTNYNANLTSKVEGQSPLFSSNANTALPEEIKVAADFKEGNNIMYITDLDFISGEGGHANGGGNTAESKNHPAIMIHELFHNLGYKDQYTSPGIVSKIFQYDVIDNEMPWAGPSFIHPLHYIDLMNFLQLENVAVGNTAKVYGYYKLDIDLSKNLCPSNEFCLPTQEEVTKAKMSEVKPTSDSKPKTTPKPKVTSKPKTK